MSTPITVGTRRIKTLVLNAGPNSTLASRDDCAVLHRATSFAVVSGVSEKQREAFQKELDKRGYAMTLDAGAGDGGGQSQYSRVDP